MTKQAMKKYHTNYNNNLYLKATDNKSVEYANQLIDTAMSRCEHPSYPANSVKNYWNKNYWNNEANEFLAQFS